MYSMSVIIEEKDSKIRELKRETERVEENKKENNKLFDKAETSWKKQFRIEKEIAEEKVLNYKQQLEEQRTKYEERICLMETDHIR